jgi:PST family polysaccharide transporter
VSHAAERSDAGGATVRQILRSSALVGGAQVLTLLIGMVRTKVLALLLRPAGFGLMGTFYSIVDLAASLAGMGMGRSVVRQIAEAASSGEPARIGTTVAVLRRAAVLLGVLGAVALATLAVPVSVLSFGNAQHAASVALLSAAVFCKVVSECQMALLQGLRRIGEFALVGALGALVGTVVSLPAVYRWREQGVALSLVCICAATLTLSWWISRRVRPPRIPMRTMAVRSEAAALLRVGVAFMASGLLMMGSAYLVRVILLRYQGLEAAGLFHAAWTLGGLYVGLVLQALGADFYPRLVAAARDDARCNRLVNEQTQVSLLLAGAGVVATLVLAPLALSLLYSRGFSAGTDSLRWICLGMALRVVTWPAGYIIIAKGDQRLFILVELAWTAVNVALSWIGVAWWGADGAGIAFFLSNLFHAAIVFPLVHRRSGFRLSRDTWRILLPLTALVAASTLAFVALPAPWANAVGAFVLALTCGACIHGLRRLLACEATPPRLRRLLARGTGTRVAGE